METTENSRFTQTKSYPHDGTPCQRDQSEILSDFNPPVVVGELNPNLNNDV
jgi:hypothetical protein